MPATNKDPLGSVLISRKCTLGKRVALSTSIPLGRLDARREKRIAVSIVDMATRIGKALHE